MKIKQRVWLYVTRNLKPILTMVAVVFLLANVTVTGILTKQIVDENERLIKESLGAVVAIETICDDAKAYMDETIYNHMSVYVQKAGSLLEDEAVLYYNLALYSSDFYSHQIKHMKISPFYEQENRGHRNVLLYGSHTAVPYFFQDSQIVLTEGRLFTDSDLRNGNAVVIVDEGTCIKENGEYRSVKVGDTISYQIHVYKEDVVKEENIIYTEDRELEVIGLFRSTVRTDAIMDYTDVSVFENLLFVTNEYIKNEVIYKQNLLEEYLSPQDNYLTNTVRVDTLSFQLKSVDRVEEFKEKCEAFLKYYKYLKPRVVANTEDYERMAPSLVMLGKVSCFCYVISGVVSILILTIMMYLSIRKRMYEMGVLLAIGIKKRILVLQVFIENMMMICLGLLLSVPSCLYLTRWLFSLLDSQDVLLKMPLVDFAYSYGIMLSISLLSMAVGVVYILKLDPKKILLMS